GPVAVAYKHVHEQPVRPTDLVAEIPPAFEAIVLQAMAKDLKNRYASAEELRADLNRFRTGRPVLADPRPRTAGAVVLAGRPAGAATAAGPGAPPRAANGGGPGAIGEV